MFLLGAVRTPSLTFLLFSLSPSSGYCTLRQMTLNGPIAACTPFLIPLVGAILSIITQTQADQLTSALQWPECPILALMSQKSAHFYQIYVSPSLSASFCFISSRIFLLHVLHVSLIYANHSLQKILILMLMFTPLNHCAISIS